MELFLTCFIDTLARLFATCLPQSAPRHTKMMFGRRTNRATSDAIMLYVAMKRGNRVGSCGRRSSWGNGTQSNWRRTCGLTLFRGGCSGCHSKRYAKDSLIPSGSGSPPPFHACKSLLPTTPFRSMASDNTLMLKGQLLDGSYRIDKIVGEGCFGVVYWAFHLSFQETVAAKCPKIPPVRSEVREASPAKFRDESSILITLSTSALGMVRSAVGATTTLSGAWTPHYVLEWLPVESLEEVLDERLKQGLRGRSLTEAMRWLDGPAQSVVFAPSENMAHKDIEPANLFFLRDSKGKASAVPTIKLHDVGTAEAMGQDDCSGSRQGLTALNYSVFSPKHCLPEQGGSRLGEPDSSSDLWSSALVMVEFLGDRIADVGEVPTSLMLEEVNSQVCTKLGTRGLFLEQCVGGVFGRALWVNPSQWFQNMGEFGEVFNADILIEAAAYSVIVVIKQRPTRQWHGLFGFNGKVEPKREKTYSARC